MTSRHPRLTRQTLTVLSLTAAAFGIQAQGTTAPDNKQVAAVFKRADANQDGKLSREEAARLPAVAERFEMFDKDKDGALTLEELSAGISTANTPGK